MAAMDFPNPPLTVGQLYPPTPVAGIPQYKWDGTAWIAVLATEMQNYVRRTGDTMTGALTMSNAALTVSGAPLTMVGAPATVTLSGNPTADFHATTKQYVDGGVVGIPGKVSKAGDTMTGHLTLPTGPAADNAVRKDYVDAADTILTSGKVNKAGDTMTGALSATGLTSTGGLSVAASAGVTGTLTAGAITCTGLMQAATTIKCYTSGYPTIDDAGSERRLLFSNDHYIHYDVASGDIKDYHSSRGALWWTRPADSAFMIIGQGYKPGGGSWGDNSDARIKTVEGDYTRGLNEITQLHPVFYTYKGNDTPGDPEHFRSADPSSRDASPVSVPYPNSPHYGVAKDGKKFAGLIAQEVEAVFPEMVTKVAGQIDGVAVDDLRNLDTTPLIFALINAIKELRERVEELEAV